MILSVNKVTMTAVVKLYRINESNTGIAWFTMSHESASIHGITQEEVIVLPVREVTEWNGKEVVIFDWNHDYINGYDGEVITEPHNIHLPLVDIFACGLRSDYAFAVGEEDYANFSIGSTFTGINNR